MLLRIALVWAADGFLSLACSQLNFFAVAVPALLRFSGLTRDRVLHVQRLCSTLIATRSAPSSCVGDCRCITARTASV